jgi:hypothetical protein
VPQHVEDGPAARLGQHGEAHGTRVCPNSYMPVKA